MEKVISINNQEKDLILALFHRLENWNFDTAGSHAITLSNLGILSEEDTEDIESFAKAFGNCGQISGVLGSVIYCGVQNLIHRIESATKLTYER